jgi:hypothetical protein
MLRTHGFLESFVVNGFELGSVLNNMAFVILEKSITTTLQVFFFFLVMNNIRKYY